MEHTYYVIPETDEEPLAYNRMMNAKYSEWNELMLDVAFDAQTEFNTGHKGIIEITRVDVEGNYLIKPTRLEVTIAGIAINGEKIPNDSLTGKEEFIDMVEEDLKAIILKNHPTANEEELEVTVSGNLYA